MRYLGVENQITQPLYDTVQLAVAAVAQTASFFVVPLNGILAGVFVKTYSHTNLVQAGRLEKGIELTIKGISFFVRDVATDGAVVSFADYLSVYNISHLNLLIGQQSFFRMTLPEIAPAAAEINYFSNIAPAPTEFKATKGIGTVRNYFPIDNHLVLEDQESIQVDVEVESAIVAVTDITLMLHGDMTRPVR